MKALLIDTHAPRVACLYADSAVGRDAMPLFLPDGRWRGRVYLALRVGRLGKSVSARFAHRYIDAYAPVLIIYNVDDDDPGRPCRGCFMDSAITAGQWLPVHANDADGAPSVDAYSHYSGPGGDASASPGTTDMSAGTPIEVRDSIPLASPDNPGRLAGTLDTADIAALAAVCVPLATADATIKNGDLLITDRHVDVDLRPDTYVTAAPALRVKVK